VDVPPVPPADLAGDPFTLGVASGDPDTASVVLWTRLAPAPLEPGAGLPAGDVDVLWEVADDDGFATVVAAGLGTAVAELAHSVHVVAGGLEPGTEYRYRFRVGDFTSPTGTTRTAPAPDDDRPVRLATASCQRFQHGYYAAHRDIAAADVDLVVFLGDYAYEYADRPGQDVRSLTGSATEATDLDGYRLRYAAGRLDPDLAAAHAAHPWVVTWDDHEVRNDYAGAADGADERTRRAAAYQAWYEHQPVRLDPPAGADYPIHRRVGWGPLVDLLVLDTRQQRSALACGGGIGDDTCPDLADGTRTLLGDEQEGWLVDALSAPSAAWTVLAQQVVMTPVHALGQLNRDAWDGYPAQRDRVTAAMTGDVVVLTGDIHATLYGDVPGADGVARATELVAPSVSSAFTSALADVFSLLPSVVPTVRYADGTHRGWLRHEVDAERWVVEHHQVDDVADPASAVRLVATHVVTRGAVGAHPA
jgi:alkaline phosphatase D